VTAISLLRSVFGLFQLAGHRGEGALLGIQIVLRGKHVEITLRHSGDQILLGRLVVGLGLATWASARCRATQFSQRNRFCFRSTPHL